MGETPSATEVVRRDHDPGLLRRAGVGMAWAQIGKLAELLIVTGIAVIVVRTLAPKGFGTYSLLTNLAGAASIFIPVVSADALGALLPRLRRRPERLGLIGLVAAMRIAVIAVVGALVVVVWNQVGDVFGVGHVSLRVLVVALGYWVAQDMLTTVSGLYTAELVVRPVALWRGGGQLLTLGGVAALALLGEASVGTVLVVVAGGYFVAIAGLVLHLRAVGISRPPRDATRFAIALTPKVWLIGVLSYLVATHVGVLVVGAVSGSAGQVAYYATAIGVLGRAQLVLVAGWSSLMIPSLGAARARSGLDGIRRAGAAFFELWLIVAIPLNLLLAALSVPLVDFLFGREYAPSGGLLTWFALLSALSALAGGPIGVSVLWALDRQSVLVRVRLAVAVVNVGIALALTARYGALGAVIGVGVAGLATSAAEFAIAARGNAVVYPWGFAARITLTAASAAGLGYAVSLVSPAALLAGAIAGAGTYLVGLRVVRPFGPRHMALLEQLSPRLARSPLRAFARS